MTSNVVSIRTGEPKPEPLQVTEYSLTVGEESYRVRRAVDRDTQRGFVTIFDDAGAAILVLSASFPSEHIYQLIVGWRTGYRQGLVRGIGNGLNDMLRRRCGLPSSTENVS
jgi:hypothetical protein